MLMITVFAGVRIGCFNIPASMNLLRPETPEMSADELVTVFCR
jgi:hypothetical protein